MLPVPTPTEWIAAATAAGLVVALGASHLIGTGRRRLTTAPLSRLGGWLLGCLGVVFVLVLGTLVATAVRASMVSAADIEAGRHLPNGPFVAHLFNPDLATTERVGWISAAYLAPLASTFGVLAMALADAHRSVGIRVAALVSTLLVALGAAYLALGTHTPLDTDPGPLAGRVAIAVLGLAVAAAVVVAADLARGDQSRVPGPVSAAPRAGRS